MKRVVLDLCAIENQRVGLGEFSLQLGRHLVEQLPLLNRNGVELVYVVPKGCVGVFGDRVKQIECSRMSRLWLRLTLQCDLFHSVHQYGRLKFLNGAKRMLLTVHDLNFLYEKQGAKVNKYRRKIGIQIKRADALTFISNYAKSDVERCYPEYPRQGEVIYNGVSDLTRLCAPRKGEYLLHLSSLMPKKNPELLVRMMEWLPDQKLVIAGRLNTTYAKNLKTIADKLPCKNVEFIGEVDDAQKAKLYAGCKMFLFPSLCEGFGLPPIEAMKFGKPVALSNLTSLPEIGGPKACYWTELEPRKMAEDLSSFMSKCESEEEAVEIKNWAAQFTWEECARRYAELYCRMVND